eukprot:6181114-Pleurochrysis_carterae.AAC.2
MDTPVSGMDSHATFSLRTTVQSSATPTPSQQSTHNRLIRTWSRAEPTNRLRRAPLSERSGCVPMPGKRVPQPAPLPSSCVRDQAYLSYYPLARSIHRVSVASLYPRTGTGRKPQPTNSHATPDRAPGMVGGGTEPRTRSLASL